MPGWWIGFEFPSIVLERGTGRHLESLVRVGQKASSTIPQQLPGRGSREDFKGSRAQGLKAFAF